MESEQEKTRSTGGRIEFLDSARGLAAMSVLVLHTVLMYNWRINHFSPKMLILLQIIFNGIDAVSFFFVLSGFVLTASIIKLQGNFDYLNYIVRRVLRIYPLYFCVVAAGYLMYGDGKFFILIQELIIGSGTHQFIEPGWTMGAEIFISLIMPVFVLTLSQRYMPYILLVISLFAYNYISPFAFHFLLGMIVFQLYRSGQVFPWLMRPASLIIVLPLLFACYSMHHLVKFSQSVSHLISIMEDMLGIAHGNLLFTLSGGASAVMILIMLRSGTIQKLLNHSILAFIGRISFSIYLVHWLVLKEFPVSLLLKVCAPGALCVITLVVSISLLTIGISYFTYRFIELPFIRLAKIINLSQWLSKEKAL